MPLVRVEVRNEYRLGMPELYTETNTEDPKVVLDGVSVAGLVGILRQLGDLSEFAAEVFYGIQEQVLLTSSRSEKVGERLYRVETALPKLEKAILAQRSHLRFAYASGSQWHTQLRTEQNHFMYSDLPQFIMDSYEDCHDPPRLHKLDKFDTGGRGSCFNRYSDPTYFQRASAGPYGAHLQSVQIKKKAHRSRKKRSFARHRDIYDAPIFMHGSETDLPPRNSNVKPLPSLDVSACHVSSKSRTEHQDPELEDHLIATVSRNGSGYIECIFCPGYPTQPEENEARESDLKLVQNAYVDLASLHEHSEVSDEVVDICNSQESSEPRSSFITWDEKLEIVESTTQVIDTTKISCTYDSEDLNTGVDLIDFDLHDEHLALSVINGPQSNEIETEMDCYMNALVTESEPVIIGPQPDEIENEMDCYMNALSIIVSDSETDVCCQTKRELMPFASLYKEDVEGKLKGSNLDDSSISFESHESHIEAHDFSKETCSKKSESDLLEDSDQVTSPHITGTSLISLNCANDLKYEKDETPDTSSRHVDRNESFYGSSIGLDSQPLLSEQTLTIPKQPLSTSGAPTTLANKTMFWTNGGLLGLAPSKPPDSVCESKDDLIKLSSQKHTFEDDEHTERVDTAGNSSEAEQSRNHFQQDDHIMKPEIKENGTSSSRIFELSNRLLVNGLQKQTSLVGDEKTGIHTGNHTTMRGKPFREQFGNESPDSPPLQHMISFQSKDSLETRKLKLCSNVDMFPSFQLVLESDISLQASDSDSDDSFCRFLYTSDDCCSHRSESNSEQWDSGFDGMPSAESVSGSLLGGIRVQQQSFTEPENCRLHTSFTDNGKEPPHLFGRKADIPNIDSLKTANNQIYGNSDGTYCVQTVVSMPDHKQLGERNSDVQNESGRTNHAVTVDKKEDIL